MKKRFIAMVLAFVMVLALGACTSETPANDPGTETPEATGEMVEGGEISVGL